MHRLRKRRGGQRDRGALRIHARHQIRHAGNHRGEHAVRARSRTEQREEGQDRHHRGGGGCGGPHPGDRRRPHRVRRQEDELPQLEELALGKEKQPSSSKIADADKDDDDDRKWPPKRTKRSRSCVATMRDSDEFGKMVAAESYRRNFQSAQRGALLGDGAAWIWNLHAKWFSSLTPITDFAHALTYLYVTATALASDVATRWQLYVGWMTLAWQGKVGEVIADLKTRAAKLEPHTGPAKLPATDPRELLRRTIGYLKNNESRMNYPDYRKQGLPVSSSMVESLVKEFNYRVKGTEKFWDNPEGAEAILQLRAAKLSDDDRLKEHIYDRPGCVFRRYKKTKPTPQKTEAAAVEATDNRVVA